ncbi:MAG TPA: TIGR03435 family protein [Bryobacteraceae bacterium]|jgi:uncharacterized protein (TIGR03435 family)|nr:TIGR03435 family protein [Bryobacteraceae bacterium]
MMWRGIVPALFVLASLAHGQSSSAQSPASHPFDAFEVATIRPTPPEGLNGGRYIRMQSAHRFQVKNYTVNGLIAAAYDLNPRTISGGPSWTDSSRYEIIAETPGDLRPTYDDQMVMLRKLLADRFNLAAHREKKEFSIYELSVAKGGPKLKASAAPPDESPNLTSTVFPAASGGIDHILLPARNVTMTQFASILQRAILDRPVVDHTGLTGRYEFDLDWTPDGTEFGGNLPPGAPDSGKPGLYASMQQQLGLKIEPTRGLVEALVIDRLDKPSDN